VHLAKATDETLIGASANAAAVVEGFGAIAHNTIHTRFFLLRNSFASNELCIFCVPTVPKQWSFSIATSLKLCTICVVAREVALSTQDAVKQ